MDEDVDETDLFTSPVTKRTLLVATVVRPNGTNGSPNICEPRGWRS